MRQSPRVPHFAFRLLLLLAAAAVGVGSPAAAAERPPGSFPRHLLRAGDRVVFSAWDPVHGRELWASDGTAEGTELLTELTPGPESAEVALHWSSGGVAYFSTGPKLYRDYPWQPPPPGGEWTFWRTDGTASGTFAIGGGLLADASVYCGTDTQRPHRIAELEDGRVLFTVAETATGWELWATDGTAGGTGPVADLLPGESSSCPSGGISMGAYALFAAIGADGWELWRSDGTPDGTYPLRPDRLEGAPVVPYALARMGDRALMLRHASELEWELWVTDGTAGGTEPVAAVSPPDAPTVWGGGLFRFHVLGRRAVFFSRLLGDPTKIELWATDGTPAGTGVLTHFNWAEAFPNSGFWTHVTRVGDRLFFQAYDYLLSHGLWATDGTAEGTGFVASLPTAGYPLLVPVRPLRDRLGLVLRGAQEGNEPWVLDPATGIRAFLGDLCPGSCGSNPQFSAQVKGGNLMVLRSTRSSPPHQGTQATLWYTDGTPEGTRRIAGPFSLTPVVTERTAVPDFPPDAPEAIRIYPDARLGDRIPFVADDGVHGIELWMSDGMPEGTSMVLDLVPDGEGLEPAEPEPPGPGEPPPPPAGAWLTSPGFPGFRFKVRITQGPDASIPGSAEPSCIPETLCVSGAVSGRAEVFVRVVGPKPNGKLWPTLVKFTTSQVEVWIEQLATGAVRYYRLAGAAPGVDELPGLFDRDGFDP